jgi:saccharopepsin
LPGVEKGWDSAAADWSAAVECSKIAELPDLTFYFSGKPYPIKASDYILQVQGSCISAFMGLDIPPPLGP